MAEQSPFSLSTDLQLPVSLHCPLIISDHLLSTLVGVDCLVLEATLVLWNNFRFFSIVIHVNNLFQITDAADISRLSNLLFDAIDECNH